MCAGASKSSKYTKLRIGEEDWNINPQFYYCTPKGKPMLFIESTEGTKVKTQLHSCPWTFDRLKEKSDDLPEAAERLEMLPVEKPFSARHVKWEGVTILVVEEPNTEDHRLIIRIVGGKFFRCYLPHEYKIICKSATQAPRVTFKERKIQRQAADIGNLARAIFPRAVAASIEPENEPKPTAKPNVRKKITKARR